MRLRLLVLSEQETIDKHRTADNGTAIRMNNWDSFNFIVYSLQNTKLRNKTAGPIRSDGKTGCRILKRITDFLEETGAVVNYLTTLIEYRRKVVELIGLDLSCADLSVILCVECSCLTVEDTE